MPDPIVNLDPVNNQTQQTTKTSPEGRLNGKKVKPASRNFLSIPKIITFCGLLFLLLSSTVEAYCATVNTPQGPQCMAPNPVCPPFKYNPQAVPPINTDYVPDPEITNEALVAKYERGPHLGSGASNDFVKVTERSTGKQYALGIKGWAGHQQVFQALKRAEILGLTPHFAKTHSIHRIEREGMRLREVPRPNFVVKPANKNESRRGSVIVSELAGGNLCDYNLDKFPAAERLAYNLQAYHAENILKRHDVLVLHDTGDCFNRVFKNMTKGDCFRGHDLSEFDYLKYGIRGVDVYIPKLPSYMKFVDYDGWEYPCPWKPSRGTVCARAENAQERADIINNSGFNSHEFCWGKNTECVTLLERWTEVPKGPAKILNMDEDCIMD